jgi:hypothetical protein
MRGLIVAAMVSAVLAAPVLADPLRWEKEPDGFRGVKFGATMDELRATHPSTTCYRQNDVCSSTWMIGSVRVKGNWRFRGGALDRIELRFHPRDYEELSGILTERYGAPMFTESSVITNALGGRFDQEELTWIGEAVALHIERYSGSIESGEVRFATVEALKRSREADDKAKRKAAEDL